MVAFPVVTRVLTAMVSFPGWVILNHVLIFESLSDQCVIPFFRMFICDETLPEITQLFPFDRMVSVYDTFSAHESLSCDPVSGEVPSGGQAQKLRNGGMAKASIISFLDISIPKMDV